MAGRANKQLYAILLLETEMEARAQHEEGSIGFGSWMRIVIVVRHASDDFVDDLAILGKWTACFEHARHGLEGRDERA